MKKKNYIIFLVFFVWVGLHGISAQSKIEIVKEYDNNFPLIEGFGGQINQVLMNILDNAWKTTYGNPYNNN